MDPSASPGERAAVGRALDADSSRGLLAGWRVYDLPAPVSLAQARLRLAAGDADAAGAVQLDTHVVPLEVPDDTHFPLQWALPAMHAPSGWDAAAGAAPVTVAVIDTGVDTSHPDLAGRLWANPGEIAANGIDDDANGYVDDVGGWNFYDWTNQVYSAADGDSHGTHVAGIIAGRRGNSAGIAGVADNARIMPLKFLKPGGGYTSDAIVAIRYAVDEGATVINASWGGAGYSQALCDAIAQAGDEGVLFVAAAGNDGADNDATGTWPANCPAPSLVSVAATTSSEGLAGFSNFGATQVDVGAPGEDVLSTIPAGGYGYKSGTSMAAPQVTGIAATLDGLHPGIAPWQVKAAITGGGEPLAALAGTTASGRRADLFGAITFAASGVGADATAPDPFALVAPADSLITTATAPAFRWAAASDAQSGVAGYRLTVDTSVVAQVAAGVTQATPGTPLPEGPHTWSVTALDVAGNARVSGARALVIDRTAPAEVPLVSPAAGATVAGPEVPLTWGATSDAVSGVAEYRVIVDGGGLDTTGPAGRSLRVRLAPGRHTWQIQAADAAGNTSAGAVRAFTVSGAAASTPVRVRPLRLSAPSRVSSGARPLLRVQLTRAARVTFSVRRASSDRPLAAFVKSVRAGASDVAVPASFARRMRPVGVYVVTARAPGGRIDTVRLSVR